MLAIARLPSPLRASVTDLPQPWLAGVRVSACPGASSRRTRDLETRSHVAGRCGVSSTCAKRSIIARTDLPRFRRPMRVRQG